MPTRTPVANDDFPYANGDVSSANWLQCNNATGAVTIYSNKFGTAYAANSWMRWTGANATNFDSGAGADQYSKCTLVLGGSASDNGRIGVVVRASSDTSPNCDCYAFVTQRTGTSTYTTKLIKYVDNVPTDLATSTSIVWVNGDTMALEIIGSGLTCYRNDVAVGGSFTTTDTALATGRPGVFASNDASTGAIYGDVWDGGTVVAGAASVVPQIVGLYARRKNS